MQSNHTSAASTGTAQSASRPRTSTPWGVTPRHVTAVAPTVVASILRRRLGLVRVYVAIDGEPTGELPIGIWHVDAFGIESFFHSLHEV